MVRPTVPARLRDERGFTMIELIAAMALLSIAILALMASYDSAFMSLHSSAKTSSAALIANNQLELYGSQPYSGIGLDSSTLSSVLASDSVYAADKAALGGSNPVDVTLSCSLPLPANCLPVQTVVGADRHSYRLETFVRDITNVGSWTERQVTVIVRDTTVAGSPKVVTLATAFDKGP
jgi:prepilin-type N-terminal cleavage/methylation domain-containing protein